MALGLSQNEMIKRLGLEDKITQSRISGYELGTREPSLPTLLLFARVAGVCVDVLIDDKLEVPAQLPTIPTHKIKARLSTGKRNR